MIQQINLAGKFTKLKTAVGGNREKFNFEDTFGMPKEEQAHITRPSRANIRILSELEFALNMSQAQQGIYDKELGTALEFLLSCMEKEGVLTNQACEKAEDILSPLQKAAKEYSLILAAHAHIDMNWMWGFNETVAIVLATFRSILNIMDQYPEFHFSQSQASVYKIVEDYDPELMEKIKQRIAEGRWEVTATSWVETDKNMPNTESLLRHIQYTREYLETVWGVQHFDIDFSPDTFGHNANIPEIDRFGDVKYFYHCRGLSDDYVLYRYRAPSGRELLAYREPYWYNSAITPHIGAGLVDISRRCAGFKTGLVVYGVGDHGGGPTRRDVERALDMMTWKIYPSIRFGTIREFFEEAEVVREKLPVVDHELNYFAPGCYTTQSRIKRGNRRLEAALRDAESLAAIARQTAGFSLAQDKLRKAWQDVLFTHFHDILTGSCVQNSREHAMGLYQTSVATANTQLQNAMRVIAEKIDTSSIPVDIDDYNTQSEGAGVGYGIENFVGVPSTERGSGRTRIFHIFNTLPKVRSEVVELTVWDWTGDLRYIKVEDYKHNNVEFQLTDTSLQQYWDHKYFRILVDVTVPAMGYTTLILSQDTPECYRTYFQSSERVNRFCNSYILQNEKIRAVIVADSGRICSLCDAATNEELIVDRKTAGLTYIETDATTSNAWQIGRYLKEIPVDKCVKIERVASGPLRQSIRATYQIADSRIEVMYSLDKHATVVRTDLKIDWHEIGKEDIVPVLAYQVPTAYTTDEYLYDVPGGAIRRHSLANDVPALQYGMAVRNAGDSAIVISDSKYGYRGSTQALSLTLINSATSPDPYPEFGIHSVTIWTGCIKADEKTAEELADVCNHAMFYQPSNAHHGILPMESTLLAFDSEQVILSAVLPSHDGELLVRMYEVKGTPGKATLRFGKPVLFAEPVDLFERKTDKPIVVKDNTVTCEVEPNSLCELRIKC